jgi:predicted LPLAT superfamily acyltransferase
VVPGEKTVRCQFFGQEAAFPAGPLLLAALAECPVILFFGLYRGGNRYDVHFETLAERIVLEPRRRQQQIAGWVQRYADRLEHYARLAPYNWFNFYDYWREEAG